MRTYIYRTWLRTDPDTLFVALTDLAGLPEWNDLIVGVAERPAALEPGAEWVVEMEQGPLRWRSRSTATHVDPGARTFAYRSRTDDGNPSYATWAWRFAPSLDGTRVTVRWELHPVTFWRRSLLVRVRARALRRREVPASVAALAQFAARRAADVNRPARWGKLGTAA